MQYFTIFILYIKSIVCAILLLYYLRKGVDNMKKRITFTLEEELIDKLKKVSEQTLIPQSKLIEKTLKQVLEEYKENEND